MKVAVIRLTMFLAIFSIAATCIAREPPVATASGEPGAPAARMAHFRVTGYLPDYELGRLDPAAVALVDELIYFSIEPRADGRLDTSRASPQALARLQKLTAGQPTRLMLSVGGGDRSGGFAAMATHAAARADFVKALSKFCLANHFAGADFDWEFPANKAEKSAYDQLLLDTKATFAADGLALSVAVIPSQQFSREAIGAVDQFHLMSYDHGGPEHATLQQARGDIRALTARGVPPEKILLGVPFYGRTRRGQALSWAQIVARFHPAAAADSADIYSFNGPETIAKKVRLAQEEKLGGLMIWELGQDLAPTQPGSLLGAIRGALKQLSSR